MIHFDFVVTDDEAENILDCIQDTITYCQDALMLAKSASTLEETWYRNRIWYLKNLKCKMKLGMY